MKTVTLLAAALALATASSASAQHAGHGGHAHHGEQAGSASHAGHATAGGGKHGGGVKCHGGKAKHTHAGAPRAKKAGASAETASTREFKEAHARMMSGMDQPFTGDADIDFRVHMIPHHQGAIDMARVAMRHAKDPWTRQLAEAVIVEQQREIAEMQAWLANRGVAAPAGGQPRHIMGSDAYRTLHEEAGTRGEARGQSWAPGSGIR
ncbi:CopM family metallochaperone [Enterovirga sp. CN4-39]|uniref:CopM family metallochaperone n=1 Tax=Enterovirga sp. CN4-39 TaxID=3400910 RepID=UPI003C035BEC